MNDFEAWQQILVKWQQVDKMKQMNQRLYDELHGALMYILEYGERNNIVLPNKERLLTTMDNIDDTVDKIRNYHNRINDLPPKTKHPFSTPDDETEPNFYISNLLYHDI